MGYFDVSEVVPEYTVGNRRVDYALRPGSPNAVFIEVKRPGENLDRHQQQLLEYCFQEGVKLAAWTNGWTWWLYLPLQAGGWEQRRFLTIYLEAQESAVVEQRFLDYLSPEKVGSGQAINYAEDFAELQQRAETISKTTVDAWNRIVERPDELLVDLIAETAERMCGFKPGPELVEQFLSRRVRVFSDASLPQGTLPGVPAHARASWWATSHEDWPGLYPLDHFGTGRLQRIPGCSATHQESVATSVVHRRTQGDPPLGRRAHGAVIQRYGQPEKQAGISQWNVAEGRHRQLAASIERP